MVTTSEKPEEVQAIFNPFVHVQFPLQFRERERLKALAIAKGITLEKLLQELAMKALEENK